MSEHDEDRLKRISAALRQLGMASIGEVARLSEIPPTTTRRLLETHRSNYCLERAVLRRRGHLTDLWSLHSDEGAP
jgi:DNA-binding IclR family transcriptional regulator